MKSKWHLGLTLCAVGACSWVVAQDPPREERREERQERREERRDDRRDEQAPPPVERREGVRVEGDVRTERSARDMKFHRVKTVIGTKVSIESDLAIGTVEDIVFSDDGCIEYIVVVNEGKLVSVPWAAAKFNFEKRTAVVALTEEKYRQIPTFTTETYPQFHDPQWRTTTYSFYNIPPRGDLNRRQERKVDKAERKIDRQVDKAERKGDRRP
jgi:hypothetical protein